METDAGKQTRLFHFGDWKPPADSQPAGRLVATGRRDGGRGGRGEAVDVARRRAVARTCPRMLAESHDHQSEGRFPAQEWCSLQRQDHAHGILRFDEEPNGDPMFVVTIVTTDPTYLSQPICDQLPSSRRTGETDAKWKPTECSANGRRRSKEIEHDLQ